MAQKVEIDGQEVEVYTAAEVQERETAAAKAKEDELGPKLSEAQKEQERLTGLLSERSREFGKFRELTEEQKLKLDATQLALYENQKLLHDEREKTAAADMKAYTNTVAAAIRSQVGTDEKLFGEVQKMYELIGLDDTTEDGIKQRVTAAVGALRHTQPDLLATISVAAGGGFEPPRPANEAEKTFADSSEGKGLASRLGLVVEPPKN